MRHHAISHLEPAALVADALHYFGQLGLRATKQSETVVHLESRNGYVDIALEAGDYGTIMKVVTDDWDCQVVDFIFRVHT